MITETAVRAALDEIHDPCTVAAGTPAGLDEFGLVGSVVIDHGPDGATVHVTVGVTEPGCLMAMVFLRDARRRLSALPGVVRVEVDLDPTLRWNETRVAAPVRARLARMRQSKTGKPIT